MDKRGSTVGKYMHKNCIILCTKSNKLIDLLLPLLLAGSTFILNTDSYVVLGSYSWLISSWLTFTLACSRNKVS